MTQNKRLANLAAVLDDGSSGQVLTSDGSGGVSFSASSGGSVTTYSDVDSLVAASSPSNGDMGFVTGTGKLYIYNGSGWYNIAVVNTSPTISSVQDASSNTTPFTLSSDGTATVITITATDAEGIPLTYSYSVTSGSLTNGGGTTATVSQGTGSNTNVFTITPTTNDSYGGEFTLTFSASDGVNAATSANAFSLSFASANYANSAAGDAVVSDSNVTRGTLGSPSTQSDSATEYSVMDIDASGEALYYHSLPTFDFVTSSSSNNRLVFGVKIPNLSGTRIGISATDNSGNKFCLHTYNGNLIHVPVTSANAGTTSYSFNSTSWFSTSAFIIYTIDNWSSTTGLNMKVKTAGTSGVTTVTATTESVGYSPAYNTNTNSISFFATGCGTPIAGYTSRTTLTQKVVGVMTMAASVSASDAIDEFESTFFS